MRPAIEETRARCTACILLGRRHEIMSKLFPLAAVICRRVLLRCRSFSPSLDCRFVPAATFFFLTMLRQHSQYDSRLGFSFRVLVMVRVRLGLG